MSESAHLNIQDDMIRKEVFKIRNYSLTLCNQGASRISEWICSIYLFTVVCITKFVLTDSNKPSAKHRHNSNSPLKIIPFTQLILYPFCFSNYWKRKAWKSSVFASAPNLRRARCSVLYVHGLKNRIKKRMYSGKGNYMNDFLFIFWSTVNRWVGHCAVLYCIEYIQIEDVGEVSVFKCICIDICGFIYFLLGCAFSLFPE